MMNAIDELRCLLDEYGVEYKERISGNTTIFDFDYCEQCDDYLHTISITGACISAHINYLEPKQAVVATLESNLIGVRMNNLQMVVKDDTRIAMHVAVELCENGDFDSVGQAFRWLMQETHDPKPKSSVFYTDPQLCWTMH